MATGKLYARTTVRWWVKPLIFGASIFASIGLFRERHIAGLTKFIAGKGISVSVHAETI